MKRQKIKKIFAIVLFELGITVSSSALESVPDSVYLFSYNVHPDSGLNIAWSADQKYWTPIGPEYAFLKSDFGSWGSEKRCTILTL